MISLLRYEQFPSGVHMVSKWLRVTKPPLSTQRVSELEGYLTNEETKAQREEKPS